MASYYLSNFADKDLGTIAAYTIQQFGIKRSRIYRDGLFKTFETIAKARVERFLSKNGLTKMWLIANIPVFSAFLKLDLCTDFGASLTGILGLVLTNKAL